MPKPKIPGLPTRDAILDFITSSPTSAGKREIAKAFGLHGADKIALKSLLKDMADEGLIDSAPGRAFHKMGRPAQSHCAPASSTLTATTSSPCPTPGKATRRRRGCA